jgi:hypothetical protein
MATVAGSERSLAQRERTFFFVMSCIMAVATVSGFAKMLLLGLSSFGEPWLVHFHAWIMMSWLGLYVCQNYLVWSGDVVLHRKLGRLAAIWLPAVFVMGLIIQRWSVQDHGGAPEVAVNEFLIGNPLSLLVCVSLAAWAIAWNRRSDWHKRLMLCSFAILFGPGGGRLIPLAPFIPYAWWFAAVGLPLIFPIIGAIADFRRGAKVHPAWFWGMGLLVSSQIAADVIAFSPAGVHFTQWFVAGTGGAQRPMGPFVQ